MIKSFNRKLKWLVIIGLVLLAMLSIYYQYDNCSKCKFEVNGTTMNTKHFMEIYSEKCFDYSQELDDPYFQDSLESFTKLIIKEKE